MQSVRAVPETDMLIPVRVSQAPRGDEIRGFHMRYCGPSGAHLSTFKHLIKLGKIRFFTSRQGLEYDYCILPDIAWFVVCKSSRVGWYL